MSECQHAVERRRATLSLPVRGERVVLHDVDVPTCGLCNEEVWEDGDGDRVLRLAYAVYRSHHGLLTPEQLSDDRKPYELQPEDVDARAMLPRGSTAAFEKGALQNPEQDARLRTALQVP